MKSGESIIVRLAGGLGNQLYQYAMGRSLSLRNERPLLLETRNTSRDQYRNYELSVFNIQEKHVDLLTQWCTRWSASYSSGKLFRTLCPLAWNYKIIRDKAAGFDPSVFNLEMGTIVLEGYWQSFKYFEPYHDIIRTEFTFKRGPTLQNGRMIEDIESVESIAMHVRRGDYITNPNNLASLGTCPPEYYQKAGSLIEQRVNKPHFFIFTDEPEWAKENVKFSGPTKVVDHNLGKADSEDFRLMTHCKHFIIANSSFSWWGAWLASFPDKIVIAPKNWFKADKFPPEDRIPEGWIRL
jgi:hypothetical protein